jgi:Ca2+-binding RTX toxin-like protein
MKKLALLATLGFAMLGGRSNADAACASSSCTLSFGVEYCCDKINTGTATVNYNHSNIAACDTVGTPANPNVPDGKCVICLTNPSGGGAVGGAADESFCGTGANDVIDGRGGVDWIEGRGGDDEIDGGNGNDVIQGDSGIDVISGGDGDDSISDTGGDTYIDAGSGNDTVVTVNTNDEIYGGPGDDQIWNHNGADWIDGGTGDDHLENVLFAGTVVEYVGSTYCGGDDDDTIIVKGIAHNCIEGGDGTDSCSFAHNGTNAQTPYDLATSPIACETSTGIDATPNPTSGCAN